MAGDFQFANDCDLLSDRWVKYQSLNCGMVNDSIFFFYSF